MLVASQGPGRSRIMFDYGRFLDLWCIFKRRVLEESFGICKTVALLK